MSEQSCEDDRPHIDSTTVFFVRTLGGFGVSRNGEPISLPRDVERLIALLSVRSGRYQRSMVASTLWDWGNDERVLGNLRSALWRLRRSHPDLIAADNQTIALAARVSTDVSEIIRRSDELLMGDAGVDWLDTHESAPGSLHQGLDDNLLDYRLFAAELLPGWYDEWVLVERERFRQICLHSLEAIARCHAASRRFGAAIQVLMSCVALDDLRESPRRHLMAIHLAEGNRCEAVRAYNEYETKLGEALGLSPSSAMRQYLLAAQDMSTSSQ